jgi:SAM-dependent methyltransferase
MELDSWQIILIVLLLLMIFNYVTLKFFLSTAIFTDTNESEAFESREGFSGGTDVDNDTYTNDTLYDKFYSKIYDQIVQGDVRVRSEVIFTLGWIKKYVAEQNTLQVLDIGSGTGGHVLEFAKEGVASAVGIDRSKAMVDRANLLHPGNTYKVGDAEEPKAFSAGEFNLVTMYYFTIYYIHHKDQLLKNIFNWLKPGGGFVIHIVNRDKFDPILESASPFSAFSVQKYSKERVMKSSVAFDKFNYTAEFSIDDNHAEFDETFKFKDGRKRKNVHKFYMPIMEKLVHEIEQAGFTYKEFIDLTPIGYEYQYLFCFVR